MKRNLLWCSLTIWFATVLLAGCGKAPSTPDSSASTNPLKQHTIGVSLANLDGPWRKQMKTDIEAEAAKHPGLRVVFRDAESDPEKQQAQINEFLDFQVRAIIVSPKDAQSLTEPLAKAFDAGIYVVVVDRAVVGDKHTCFIAADPKQIGSAAGQWLESRLHGKGKIVEIKGPVDSLPAQELHSGFRAALKDPGYRFVAEGFLDPPKVDAAKVMREALGHFQQIDAVFACDDATAAAAYHTAKAAGREKGILFVGVGGMPGEGQDYVAQGILAASFLLPTGGAEALDTVEKLIRREKPPKKIAPPTRVITK